MPLTETDSPAASILASNPVLTKKISAALQLDESYVAAAITEVVRFLDLIGQSGERLTPSQRVDLAWHELILCTRYYADFCEQRYGRFIHHHPGGDEKENNDQFHKTLTLYREQFGEPPVFWWGGDQHAECGNCEAI